MDNFFQRPFGQDGDKTAIPVDTQPDGSVSFRQGWTFDYQREQGVDPDSKDIPRDQFNQLMFMVTSALREWQTRGFPDFITSANNGGSPFPYDKYATVRFDDGSGVSIYESQVNANTTDPTNATNWKKIIHESGIPVGVTMEYSGLTAPNGWLLEDGKTLSKAGSGGTARANADAEPLYTHLWNNWANAELPIQDSGGTPTTRGASAADDFAAGKRLPLPFRNGTVAVCKDNMGGVSAGRMTASTAGGLDGTILGKVGGGQDCILTVGQMPSHVHQSGGSGFNVTVPSGGVLAQWSAGSPDHREAVSADTGTAGQSQAHNNVQPGIVKTFIIKL